MKASFVIPYDGDFNIIVTPETFEKDAPQMQMRVYRNRTRLLATEATYESRWRGHLDKDDLIEADGEFPVSLTVVSENVHQPGDVNRHYSPVKEQPHADHPDPRDNEAGHPIAHV